MPAAGLILLAIAAAVQPAIWVLSFAIMTRRRQLLLAFWAVLLAAVLPFIHWLSAAHAMPTILVRKGEPLRWNKLEWCLTGALPDKAAGFVDSGNTMWRRC